MHNKKLKQVNKFKLIHVFGPFLAIFSLWFLFKILGYFFGIDTFNFTGSGNLSTIGTISRLLATLIIILVGISLYIWIPAGLIIYFILKNKNKG